MDKQIANDLKKIMQGILIYDILGILVLIVIMKATLATIGGLLLGSLTSIVALIMIARNVIGLVEREKVKAALTATAGYSAAFDVCSRAYFCGQNAICQCIYYFFRSDKC